jgi:hypothetical protein
VIKHSWASVAELVIKLVHSYVSAVLGHAKAALLMGMIANCTLGEKQKQEKAEKMYPPALVWRGARLERRLSQREVTVRKLMVIYEADSRRF